MRKLSFKFLSALLAVLMLLSAASTIAFAEGDGFNQEIMSFDASDYATDTQISSTTNSAYKTTKTLKIVDDGEEKALSIPNGGHLGLSYGYFAASDQYYYSASNGKSYPRLIKAEVEFRRTVADDVISIFEVCVASDANTYNSYAKIWSKSGTSKACYYRKGAGAPGTGTAGTDYYSIASTIDKNDEYHTLTMYFDFAARKYYVYLDGELQGPSNGHNNGFEVNPADINFKGIYFKADRQTAYIKNITISTVDAYTPEAYNTLDMYEYELPDRKGVAVGYENRSENSKTFNLIQAKYNADDELVDVNVNSKEVAAGTGELLTSVGTNGYTYKFFLWEGFNTMKPLVNAKTID